MLVEGARALARLHVLADPVHAGPAAVGHHRRQRLRPAHERVRVPARPGLREPPARRRGQPRLAEDAVGAARVHAGGAGDGRRRQLRAAAAVHGHRDAEPDRVRGHVSAARGAARPVRDAALARLPAARRRGADARAADVAIRRRTSLEPVCSADDVLAASPRTRRRSTSRRASTATSSPLLRHTRADPRLYLGASPRAGIALLRVAKARALAAGRSFVSPDDVKAIAEPVLAHRLIVAPEARSAGLAAEDAVREAIEKTPVPV